MNQLETIEAFSEKYAMTKDDFWKRGACSILKEKKNAYLNERLEILLRSKASSIDDLEAKIKSGEIAEHPGWEDLIELRNIEAEIKEINSDIRSLQSA